MKCILILSVCIGIAAICLAGDTAKYDGYVINLGKILQKRTDVIHGQEYFSYSSVFMPADGMKGYRHLAPVIGVFENVREAQAAVEAHKDGYLKGNRP